MQTLKESKSLLISLLVVLLVVLLCFNLPSLPFWLLCLKEDLFRPPNTEVLVSACKSPGVRSVPGGEVLFVREGRTGKMYLLDLRTGEKRDVPNDPLLLDHGVFLSSELVWLDGGYSQPESPGYRPHYILDLTDGQRYELLDMTWLPLLNGKFDPKNFSYIKSAEQVFIDHTEKRLIALAPDFRQHPGENVIFSESSLGSVEYSEKGKLLEQLMKNLGKGYEIVDFSLDNADVPSPTGKYITRNDGRYYFSGTNTPVVTRPYMGGSFKSWYYDESGVVVQGGGYDLIHIASWNSFYYIPSPILKLRLPAP